MFVVYAFYFDWTKNESRTKKWNRKWRMDEHQRRICEFARFDLISMSNVPACTHTRHMRTNFHLFGLHFCDTTRIANSMSNVPAYTLHIHAHWAQFVVCLDWSSRAPSLRNIFNMLFFLTLITSTIAVVVCVCSFLCMLYSFKPIHDQLRRETERRHDVHKNIWFLYGSNGVGSSLAEQSRACNTGKRFSYAYGKFS